MAVRAGAVALPTVLAVFIKRRCYFYSLFSKEAQAGGLNRSSRGEAPVEPQFSPWSQLRGDEPAVTSALTAQPLVQHPVSVHR